LYYAGKGIYKYVNGSSFEGEFLEDLKHGYGVYKYFTGETYEGEKNGRPAFDSLFVILI